MADRIISMRALLKKNLEDLGSKHDWSHITSQVMIVLYAMHISRSDNGLDRYVCLYWAEARANGLAGKRGESELNQQSYDGAYT